MPARSKGRRGSLASHGTPLPRSPGRVGSRRPPCIVSCSAGVVRAIGPSVVERGELLRWRHAVLRRKTLVASPLPRVPTFSLVSGGPQDFPGLGRARGPRCWILFQGVPRRRRVRWRNSVLRLTTHTHTHLHALCPDLARATPGAKRPFFGHREHPSCQLTGLVCSRVSGGTAASRTRTLTASYE